MGLEELNTQPGVQATVCVGKDGLLITALGDAQPDPDFLGAETAELLQSAELTMRDKLDRGELKTVSFEAENGYVFLRSINEVTYLMLLTGEDISLGMIRYSLEKAGRNLKDQL